MAEARDVGNIVQLNLPGTCRADKKARPPKISEGAIQAHTRTTLGLMGYLTLETGKARKKVTCEKCRHTFFPTGWQGNTPGFPDLTVLRRGWPAGGALVEMKGETTPVETEQQQLADAGPFGHCMERSGRGSGGAGVRGGDGRLPALLGAPGRVGALPENEPVTRDSIPF